MGRLAHWLHTAVFGLAAVGVWALPVVGAAVQANPIAAVSVALLTAAVTHAGRSALE